MESLALAAESAPPSPAPWRILQLCVMPAPAARALLPRWSWQLTAILVVLSAVNVQFSIWLLVGSPPGLSISWFFQPWVLWPQIKLWAGLVLLGGAVLYGASRMLGGHTSLRETTAVAVWSQVPTLCAGAIALVVGLAWSRQMARPLVVSAFPFLWGQWIVLIALAESARFTWPKALGAYAASAAVFAAALWLAPRVGLLP